MQIRDQGQFQRYTEYMAKQLPIIKRCYEIYLPLVLFGIVGSFGWAIRGTGGFGGTSGALVAGMWWGLLFFTMAKVRGIDARWQALALGLGIGFGGMTGYGQFLSWIRAQFGTGADPLPISPLIGFLWLALIGIEWGGTAAVILGWSLTPITKKIIWLWRVIFAILGGIIGYYVVSQNPEFFFPFYSEFLYNSAQCAVDCGRTASTLPNLGMLLGITIGLTLVELIFVRNRLVWKAILIMATGFAFVFPVASCWFYLSNVIPFHWWKVWEESIGLVGGLSIGLVFLMVMSDVNKHTANYAINITTLVSKKQDWKAHLALQCALLIMTMYLLNGFSKADILYLYGNAPTEENSFPLGRILILAIGLISILLVFGLNLKHTRNQYRSSQTLFVVPQVLYKFVHLSLFATLVGIVAIGGDFMLLIYILFGWSIIALILHYHSFLLRNKSAEY